MSNKPLVSSFSPVAASQTARNALADRTDRAVRSRPLLWSAAATVLLALGAAGCTSSMHQGDKAAGTTGTGTGTGMGMDHKNMAPDKTVAQAQLKTTDGTATGMAMLRSLQGGAVEISVRVEGMQPGTHGFHIHEKGECAPKMNPTTGKMEAFGAAGGHFDPHSTKTHGQPGQSSRQIHAGDVPNLVVSANGTGMLRYTSQDVTLMPGENSIMGRSLVVHADEDDYKTNPAGNSGARIACGVIELVRGHTLDRSNMARAGMAAVSQPALAR